MDFGSIVPRRLSQAEEQECRDFMAKARPVLDALAERSGGHREFRRTMAGLDLSPEEQQLLQEVKRWSVLALGHIVSALWGQAFSFAKSSPSRVEDSDDYFQIACMAALDAFYRYDGSTKIITSLVHAAMNRMRSEHKFWKIRPDMVNERTVLSDGKEVNLSELTTSCDTDEAAVNEDQQLVRAAIEAAGLSPIQQELVNGFLAGNTFFQRDVAKVYGITRGGAQYHYRKACEKIRAAYEALTRRAAA